MEWKVDREASKPLYQQIFEFIEERKLHTGNFLLAVYCLQNVNWLNN